MSLSSSHRAQDRDQGQAQAPTGALARATILVVDDEKTLRDTLEYNLRREGYRVVSAADGSEAIRIAYAERPDLIILDIMLPGLSGYDVCRAIRKELDMPILMLSAREDEIDKVLGLELGADDYLTKPFSLRELLARVRAMLRRAGLGTGVGIEVGTGAATATGTGTGSVSEAKPAPVTARQANAEHTGRLVAGDLAIDLLKRTVTLRDTAIEMKPKEFDLLAFLASHPMQVFSREVLLDRVWGYDYVGGTRTVDVHVHWLRSKLERDPANPELIQTVYGVGYRFVPPRPQQ
jgi:DNA-binding response OmpR family regulator